LQQQLRSKVSAPNAWHWEDSVPQFVTLPLAQAKQFWKQKFHAANEKAQHALMRGLVFFFLEAEDFFFSYCSHHIPMGFPKASPSSQVVPQDFPNSTSVLSHMVLPKVQLPCIQNRKAGHRGAQLFLCCNLGSKEMPNVPKKLLMGQLIWPLPLPKKDNMSSSMN